MDARRDQVVPHEDYGFFGPDSVTWRVWSYPTSLTIGFQRAVVVATQAIRYRPRTRYDRTLRDVLVKVHSKAIGVDSQTGARYDANDPASQLWIHLTAWHSIRYADEYGPGRLSADDEARYWAAAPQPAHPAPAGREAARAGPRRGAADHRRDGYRAVSIDAIARELGVARPVVYHVFDGLEALRNEPIFAVAVDTPPLVRGRIDCDRELVRARFELLVRLALAGRERAGIDPASVDVERLASTVTALFAPAVGS